MATRPSRIELVVSRWGNSLAVRLPAEALKASGIGEGDKLLAEFTPDGRLLLAPERKTVSKEAIQELRRFVANQKMSPPVVAAMRKKARY